MAQSRGKQFESIIREAFASVHGVSIDRLLDPMAGYAGVRNICDFIVYKYPYEYYIECKTVHGNTLPFSNITENQWQGLLAKSEIGGVFAGVICWWVDHDETLWLDIRLLEQLRRLGYKSVNYYASWVEEDIEHVQDLWTRLKANKKRVFFEYDMKSFLEEVGRDV